MSEAQKLRRERELERIAAGELNVRPRRRKISLPPISSLNLNGSTSVGDSSHLPPLDYNNLNKANPYQLVLLPKFTTSSGISRNPDDYYLNIRNPNNYSYHSYKNGSSNPESNGNNSNDNSNNSKY
jgi:hypothetical protein